jgi:predicted methyltransferase
VNNLISKIKELNPDLKKAEIEGLLYILKNKSPITNQDLVTLTGVPKETLKQFKKSISDYLQKTEEDSVFLCEYGKAVMSEINLTPYKWSLYPGEVSHIDSFKKVVEIMKKYDIEPRREYDQFLATHETSYNKAQILFDKGMVEGKSIAFIGDDDLNSLTLGILALENSEENPDTSYKNIAVFDIDNNVLDSVKNASEKIGLKNIELVNYDARNKLDKKHLGKFDVVIFDPPYTRSGVALFLQRAIELLGNITGGNLGNLRGFEGKYIFMYYGNSFKSPEKTLKIQEVISKFNLVIEDKIEKFARYTGAESIGSASSLYVLKVNKFTHANNFDSNKIYTYEEQKEEKFPFVDHVVFKVFGVKNDVLKSKAKVLSALGKLCTVHNLKVMDKKVTSFKGGGMTVTFVLANSNLVAHTWPEFGSVHIDLITCSPIYKKDTLSTTVCEMFGTDKIEVSYIE